MFHIYIANVLSGCCICVSIVFQVFSCVFACVSAVCFKCSSVFTHMLQMFHLGILETDRVLLLGTHLPQQASERGSRGGASGLRVKAGDASDVWTARAPTWGA
jgi:hypothetical protein